jgi:hypothetical protein
MARPDPDRGSSRPRKEEAVPYTKSQTKKLVRVSSRAKETVKSRRDAGEVIAANSPNSPILQANGDVKQAASNLITANDDLDAQGLKVKALESELAAERGGLANLIVDWDASYDVFVSTARLYCTTDEDAKALGLAAVGLASYALAMPISVGVVWDALSRLLRIRVTRAPGLRSVRLEISPDPITATSFAEIPGDGALAALPGYLPGTYWVRAASLRARERSEFTAPVSVVVT